MDISVREAGRRGGLANLDKFGSEYFVRIGRLGGLRTKALHSDHYSEWGRMGGRPKKPKLKEIVGQDGKQNKGG